MTSQALTTSPARRFPITLDSLGGMPTEAGHAEATGYATLSNFNRRFRDRLGMAPREYRGESIVCAGNHQNLPPLPQPCQPLAGRYRNVRLCKPRHPEALR